MFISQAIVFYRRHTFLNYLQYFMIIINIIDCSWNELLILIIIVFTGFNGSDIKM